MALTDNDLEKLQQFFNQTLTERERVDFEKRLNSDADFKQAVYEYQATHALLNSVRERQQKTFLKNINASMPPVEKDAQYAHLPDAVPVRRIDTKWWTMAAIGLVLVAAGYWFFSENTGVNTHKSAYLTYFEAPKPMGIERSENADNEAIAARTYLMKDYKKAVDLYQKVFEEKQDSSQLFFKAMAYMGDKQTQKALPILEKLSHSASEKIDLKEIDWYLALCYFDGNDTQKALILLEKIENTEGSSFHDLAIKLKQEINKNK